MKLIDRLFGSFLYDEDGTVTNGMYLIRLAILVVTGLAVSIALWGGTQ